MTVMQQLFGATNATEFLLWVQRTCLSPRVLYLPVYCLPALPRTQSCFLCLSSLLSLLPHPCLCGKVLHKKGAWLLPGTEESLLTFEAKAAFFWSAHAQHFGRMGVEQMLS